MSDSTPFGFGKFVPGFDFLQSLGKGNAGGMPQMPQLGSWVAPTISVEELEKRIEELKSVQFWLDQNSRALTATVQAMEVQKMTLATLKGMNVSMNEVAMAFQAKTPFSSGAADNRSAPADAPAASAASAPFAAPAAATEGGPQATPANPETPADSNASAQAGSAGVIDPMQWWGALTQQFQQIAAATLKEAAEQSAPGAKSRPRATDKGESEDAGPSEAAKKPAINKPAVRNPAAKKPGAKKPAAPKSAAPKPAATKPAAKKPAARNVGMGKFPG